jgi:cytoskeleton protein RodZ
MRGARSQDHDPAQSLMREVGAQLRQARLERGEDLNEVAQQLRIKSSYLFGLEQGDLSAMPGRPYALGFLRSYADHLGFDGEDLVTRIKSTVENLTDQTSLRIRAPMPENRLPKTPIVVISLAVVAGIYAGWSYLNRSSRMVVDTVAEVPSDLRARTIEAMPRDSGEAPSATDSPIEGRDSAAIPQTASGADPSGAAAASHDPAPPAVPPTTDAESREAISGATAGAAGRLGSAEPPRAAPDRLAAPEAGPSVEQRGALAQGVAPGALAVQPAAGAAAISRPNPPVSPERDSASRADPTVGRPGAQVNAPSNADGRVVLRARERAWIQVSSRAGDYMFTRTLDPGDAFVVPNRSDLELWTGNASGLEVVVDGAAVPALAGGGAVRRQVSLDPDRLLQSAQQPR